MLEINGIVKNFGDVEALKGIELNISRGEFFGLLGPNGAGKTTLLNIIIGYLMPDEGTISINGEAMVYDNLETKRLFGYVPQEIALFKDLTAIKNMEIFGELYGLRGKELKDKIEFVLDVVQLSHRKNEKVKNYSGGMKRRLNIAVSILHDPEFLLCDEPTIGVDPQSRNAIFDLLQDLNGMGKTILYTTHYMEEAERLCNKLAIIDHGEIIAQGSLNDLLSLLDQKITILITKAGVTNDKVEELKEIGEIKENDFYYILSPKDKYTKVLHIFNKLEEIKIPDEFVEVKKASLEDVFFHLTGRKLRD